MEPARGRGRDSGRDGTTIAFEFIFYHYSNTARSRGHRRLKFVTAGGSENRGNIGGEQSASEIRIDGPARGRMAQSQ